MDNYYSTDKKKVSIRSRIWQDIEDYYDLFDNEISRKVESDIFRNAQTSIVDFFDDITIFRRQINYESSILRNLYVRKRLIPNESLIQE